MCGVSRSLSRRGMALYPLMFVLSALLLGCNSTNEDQSANSSNNLQPTANGPVANAPTSNGSPSTGNGTSPDGSTSNSNNTEPVLQTGPDSAIPGPVGPTLTLIDSLDSVTGWRAVSGPNWAGIPAQFVRFTDLKGPTGATWLRIRPNSSVNADISGAGIRLQKTLSSAVNLADAKNVAFWVATDMDINKTMNRDAVQAFKLYLGSDGDGSFKNSIVAKWTADWNKLRYNEFAHVILDRSEFGVSSGNFDWNAVRDIRIELQGSTGRVGAGNGIGTPDILIQGLYANVGGQAYVAFSHDDGAEGIYSHGFPLYQKYNIKTTQNVIPSEVDINPSSMTSAQIVGMYNAGHDITIHATYSGLTMPEINNADALRVDIRAGLDWLTSLGLMRSQYLTAWPEGKIVLKDNTLAFPIYNELGITAARGSAIGYQSYSQGIYNSVRLGDNPHPAMYMRARPYSSNGYPISTAERDLDEVVKYGGLMIIELHNVLPEGTPLNTVDITPTDLETLITTVKRYEASGLVSIKRLSDLIDENGQFRVR